MSASEPPHAPNPYAPPVATIDGDVPVVTAVAGNLASRWQRLGGSLLDGLFTAVSMIPCYFGITLTDLLAHSRKGANPFMLFTDTGRWGVIGAVTYGAFMILQWTLLATRGQTIGKSIAGTRVVRADEAPAGFLRAVVLRLWPIEIVSRVGLLQWLTLLDVLFIFGGSRRCLHDRIAGTIVVRAS